MKKTCELCKGDAQIYCESDQADLCFHCDEKVHAANFLVAKHRRCLLCNVCHAQTPWTASGTKVTHTICVCSGCISIESSESQRNLENHVLDTHSDYTDEDGTTESDSDSEDSDDDSDEEMEGGNQVVPCSPPYTPPRSPVLMRPRNEILARRAEHDSRFRFLMNQKTRNLDK